jgi:hypothetical protein
VRTDPSRCVAPGRTYREGLKCTATVCVDPANKFPTLVGRETAILVRDTDRAFARLVGGVLTAAKTGSKDMADAHVVAAAIDAGGGVIVTGDEDDLQRLAAPYKNIHVRAI